METNYSNRFFIIKFETMALLGLKHIRLNSQIVFNLIAKMESFNFVTFQDRAAEHVQACLGSWYMVFTKKKCSPFVMPIVGLMSGNFLRILGLHLQFIGHRRLH